MSLGTILNQIKDFAFHDVDYGMEVRCATCSAVVYEVEEGDWLECMVLNALDHDCKAPVYVEPKPRCEWNRKQSIPPRQCLRDGTEEVQGELYCRKHRRKFRKKWGL